MSGRRRFIENYPFLKFELEYFHNGFDYLVTIILRRSWHYQNMFNT